MISPPTSPGRRSDLDWIRIAALALLILYHVGLAYTPWDWHINSTHRFAWMEEVVLLTSPWRLTLLFLVSGCALRLMSRKFTATEVLRARFARLAPPFLFGVLFLIPPQSFLEAISKGGFSGTFTEWWIREFSPAGIADGVPVNHLWFVLYIAVYSLVAVILLFRPTWIAAAEAWLEKTLTGWKLLVLPILYLAVIRQLLFPWFGISNKLETDWYNHAMSLGVFLFGFLIVSREGFWRQVEKLRWIAAPLALGSLVALMTLHAIGGVILFGSVKNTVFAINQWATITAVLGFASLWLRAADGPVKRYLNDAIFPCYLAHQTLLVAALYVIKPVALPAIVEAPLLIGLTFAGSLTIYEVVRRIDRLRPLWGLKPFDPPVPATNPAREALITAIRNDQQQAPAARTA